MFLESSTQSFLTLFLKNTPGQQLFFLNALILFHFPIRYNWYLEPACPKEESLTFAGFIARVAVIRKPFSIAYRIKSGICEKKQMELKFMVVLSSMSLRNGHNNFFQRSKINFLPAGLSIRPARLRSCRQVHRQISLPARLIGRQHNKFHPKSRRQKFLYF